MLNQDDDYYWNAEGKMVLTAEYLLNRGYCCGNGCLNCPYDYKMVPEPRRTRLLKERSEKTKRQPPENRESLGQ